MTRAFSDALAQALERAVEFVAREGGELDRLRVQALVDPAPAARVDEIVGILEKAQRPDGSFEYGPGRGSPLAASVEALELFDEVRRRRDPRVERGVVALTAWQAPDGSWCEDGNASILARRTWTGRVAGLLAKSVYARPATLDAAADYLAALYTPADLEAGDWALLAAHASLFSNHMHDSADEILARCGRELERGFRGGRFDAVRTARVLTLCDASGLPGAELETGELRNALLAEQREDGGWPASEDDEDGDNGAGDGEASGDEPGGRVRATVEAAVALVRLAPR